MATVIRGQADRAVAELRDALDGFEHDHPGAEATLYRQDHGAVRVRVVSDHFAGMTKGRRHRQLWDYLTRHANPNAMEEIEVLLALPTSELRSSLANLDFDHPIPA